MDKNTAFKKSREALAGDPARLSGAALIGDRKDPVVVLQAWENDTCIVLYGKDIDTVFGQCKNAMEGRDR